MQCTIRIQLQPDIHTADVLTQTIEQYTWSFNNVCQHGWEHGLSSGTELHKATYYDHRTITGLPAQLVCAAIKATEALKSAKARKHKELFPVTPVPTTGEPPQRTSSTVQVLRHQIRCQVVQCLVRPSRINVVDYEGPNQAAVSTDRVLQAVLNLGAY